MSITGTMQWTKSLMVAGALAVCAFAPGAVQQAAAQDPTGSAHGHVQNAAGVTETHGDVKFTTDSNPNENTKFKYDLTVGPDGTYKSDSNGIIAGSYTVVFMQDGKLVDELNHVKIDIGQDATVDFDMTRPDFLSKMTPQQKKELADYKAKVSAASAENAKINNLNGNLQQSRTLMKASHANCTAPKSDAEVCPATSASYDQAATLMLAAVTDKPDQPILWFTLGDAQTGQKKYDDAATSYNKAITLNDASKKPNPELDGAADNNLGQSQAKAGKTADAVASFDAAVKAQPTQAGLYYFNEAAVFFNKAQTGGDPGAFTAAATAADKAIAADPTQPLPYYIKATALIQNATVDAKTNKIVAPPGCAEAYQKYLELAPDGQYADDATSILASMGQVVHNSYKAKKN